MSDVVALTREEARTACDAVDMLCHALYPVAHANGREVDEATQNRLQALFHKLADAAGYPTATEALRRDAA